MRKSFKWAIGIFAGIGILAVIGHNSGAPNTPAEWKARAIDPRGAAFVTTALEQDLVTYLNGGKSIGFWDSRVPLAGRLTARQYYSDYHANEVAADAQYKGKLLAVKGVIAGINKDAFGNAYLDLAAGGMFSNVHAQLTEATATSAGNFSKGQSITLFCNGGTMVIGFPTLDNCNTERRLVEQESHKAREEISAVLSGNSTSPDDLRKHIAVMYLIGSLLPENGPCEKANAWDFDACAKAVKANNPVNSADFKAKYERLRKDAELPPLRPGNQ